MTPVMMFCQACRTVQFLIRCQRILHCSEESSRCASAPCPMSAPAASMVCHLSVCVRLATLAAGGALIDRYPCTHYRRRNLPDYVDQGDQERWNLPKV